MYPRSRTTRRRHDARRGGALAACVGALALLLALAAPAPARASSSAGEIKCASGQQAYECSCNNEVVNYKNACDEKQFDKYTAGLLKKYKAQFADNDAKFQSDLSAVGTGATEDCFACPCYKAAGWTDAGHQFVGTCCAQECTGAATDTDVCMPNEDAARCTDAKCGASLKTALETFYSAKEQSTTATCTDASKEALQNLMWDKCFYRWYYTQLTKPEQDLVQKRIDTCLGINWGYTLLVAFASVAIGLAGTAGVGQLTLAWTRRGDKKKAAAAGGEDPDTNLVGIKEESAGASE